MKRAQESERRSAGPRTPVRLRKRSPGGGRLARRLAPRTGANLYRFARLVLGPGPSDREVARRWGIDEKNLRRLKEGTGPAPKVHRLVDLARLLGVDRQDVVDVALGTPAEIVHAEMVRRREAVARMARHSARPGVNRRQDLLLTSLNSAAAVVHRSLDPDEAIRFVSSELNLFGIDTHVFFFDEEHQTATMAHSSFPEPLLRTAERLVGIRREQYRFVIEDVAGFREVLRHRGTFYYPDATALMREMLGRSRLERLIGRLLRIFPLKEVILAPLVSGTEVIGVLAAGSGSIRESDAPAILAFAHHISTALHNAKLYQGLRASEERLRLLVDRLPQGVFRTDPEGRIVSINERGARLLGFDGPDQVIGRDALSLMKPQDVTVLRRHEKRPDALPVFRGTIRRWDGSTIAVEASWILDTVEGAQAEYRTGVFREIGGAGAPSARARSAIH